MTVIWPTGVRTEHLHEGVFREGPLCSGGIEVGVEGACLEQVVQRASQVYTHHSKGIPGQ